MNAIKKITEQLYNKLILKPLYLILKKDIIKRLKAKNGEQFVDDVMQTLGMPTNFMGEYYKSMGYSPRHDAADALSYGIESLEKKVDEKRNNLPVFNGFYDLWSGRLY